LLGILSYGNGDGLYIGENQTRRLTMDKPIKTPRTPKEILKEFEHHLYNAQEGLTSTEVLAQLEEYYKPKSLDTEKLLHILYTNLPLGIDICALRHLANLIIEKFGMATPLEPIDEKAVEKLLLSQTCNAELLCGKLARLICAKFGSPARGKEEK